jgi:peptidylprolyl isomerase
VLVATSVTIGTVATGASAARDHARPRGTSSLDDVDVTGNAGEKPTLDVAAPFSTKRTSRRVIITGSGETVAKGDKVTIDYVAVNGRTGAEIASSYGDRPLSLTLDPTQVVRGMVKGLHGLTVGTRVIIAVAPKDAYRRQGGVSQVGIKKNDSIVFVVDLEDRRAVLTEASGDPVEPVPGLPTVEIAKGKPRISVPKTDPPATLVAQPLIKGTGPAVGAGQNVTVHYTGVVWASGKQFDSSWDRGRPLDVVLGAGSVIAGWDEGLVGQTVGTRVLLVVPPDKGYGSQGVPAAGIGANATLVFVVDILDAS